MKHLDFVQQCLRPDMNVRFISVTEQWAQFSVVGPKSRELLNGLLDAPIDDDSFPYMGCGEVSVMGVKGRLFRISFSGELSYEISVPAAQGMPLWDRLMEAGRGMGMMPYGTEALHVLRAEKSFIMIGDETDGTVIPQDLGLDWAISKKKEDYLGKRAQARAEMTRPDRWRLVGLETEDGSVLPDGAYIPAEGRNANGQRNTQGRVTSTYYSPTLKRGIAMALVAHGPERMGEVVEVPKLDGTVVRATIVSPVFYDKEGAKQDV